MSVVNLLDRAPVAVADQPDLCRWAVEWLGGIERGEYGKIRSLVLVVESDEGQLAVISQSIGAMDRARLVGLLTTAAHRRLNDGCRIEDLQQ